MRPLTTDDLLPLEEFAPQRRALFEAHLRYLDRYRRLRIGPRLTLLFENRQTLWFRIQEVVRIARLTDPDRLNQELAIYNRLLPGRGCLQATLLIDIVDESRMTQELAMWQDFRGEELRLRMGGAAVPAKLVTARAGDLAIGSSHWVQFVLDEQGRRRFADVKHQAFFECVLPAYKHESEPLSEDVRRSLLDDLECE